MLPSPDPQLARAETRIFKAVFSNTANHYDTLLGGTSSLQVRMELFMEQMDSDERLLAVTSLFTFVAVDGHRRSVPVRPAAALPPVAAA
ncbi:hypothetical protein GCM10022409_46950 [Hymenobacter glaciei]|uniref:HotDog ACOT-type domain-containing protein n=1 Tax=Hymenobacter glaciei TaxID=877209 RepID=A0ABP7UWI0_9BACT